MARRADHRGPLTRIASVSSLSVGIQSRAGECSLHADADHIVAVHGYCYLTGTPPTAPPRTPAALVAACWAAAGRTALAQIDGEYSLLVHERRTGHTWLQCSLSGTRPLYWAARADLLVAASEIRQVAAGVGIPQRLAPAALVELLCFHGTLAEREATEYQGIRRLAPGRLYARLSHPPRLHPRGDWQPPDTLPATAIVRGRLPAEAAELLGKALAALPADAAFTLSGGYDSGTLWLLARRRPDPPQHAVAMTFPGMPHDETPVIQALLRQTGGTATFVDATRRLPSDSVDAMVAAVDRVLAAPTFSHLEVLAGAVRAAGGGGLVTGLGAEVSLEATGGYAADLLRHGALVTLLLDALRFRSYAGYEPRTLPGRVKAFARAAVLPSGSRLRRRRPQPPRWLHPAWRDAFLDAHASRQPTAVPGGYARAEKLALLRDLGCTAYDNFEQICQHFGLEAYHPYFQRSLMALGFRVPPRVLNRGRHSKQLLREVARLALDGAEPPWPQRKVIFDAMVERDSALLLGLGPARRWGLVAAGILDAAHVAERVERVHNAAPLRPMDSILALAERYWRRYG